MVFVTTDSGVARKKKSLRSEANGGYCIYICRHDNDAVITVFSPDGQCAEPLVVVCGQQDADAMCVLSSTKHRHTSGDGYCGYQ